MERLLKAFATWRLAEPGARHKLLVNASHNFASENALFMICAWDYVFHANGTKAEGFRELFLERSGKLSVNLPDALRQGALGLLRTGTSYVPAPERMMAIARGPGTRLRGPATVAAPPARGRGLGTSHRPMGAAGREVAGGIRLGGAANYNLVTQALTVAVPEIDTLIRDAVGQPGDFHAGPKVDGPGHPLLAEAVALVRGFWGADVEALI